MLALHVVCTGTLVPLDVLDARKLLLIKSQGELSSGREQLVQV